MPMRDEALRALLMHVPHDHAEDRIAVIGSEERGFDVVLRIDGRYMHRGDAEDVRRVVWEELLDAALAELRGAER